MNPYEQYLAVLDEAAPLAEKYMATDASRVLGDLRQRVEDDRIRIMLFGAYNAGKSTLLNALLGKESARIGDVPTTDRIDRYNWHGHVLLDTPGVNAPIEHQEVSVAELERTDLVLYVMRQEDQDAKDSIDRLFRLLKAGRPLFLLLNYEESDEAIVRQVREKLSQTLLEGANRYGYDLGALAQLPVMQLNAKAALRARLEGKLKLQEFSGYDDFMLRFTDWLRKYDDKTQRLVLLRGRVQRELLNPVRQAVEQRLPDGSGDVDVLSTQIAHIQREESILRDSLRNKARAEISLRRPDLNALLADASSQQAVIAGVTVVADSVAETMRAWLDGEIAMSLEKSLRTSLQAAGVEVPDAGRADLDSSSFDSMAESAVSGIKTGATPENIKQLLLFGRKLKIPGLKGRWEKTFEKWAGKAGPVIVVVTTLVEMGLAHRSQEKANEQALNVALQRNEWIDSVCADMLASLTQSIDAFLMATFEDFLAPLKKQKEKVRSSAKDVERDLLAWDALAGKLLDARF